MRMDFIAAEPEQPEEIAAIEAQWTRAWQAAGGPQGLADRIPGKEEYRAIAPWLGQLPPGARLLDGGCGLGDWTLHFTRAGLPTLGLDISRATVELLQRKFPEAEFAVGDIRRTGLPDASFDGYFSWGTFEHFQDGLGGCVAEAHRLLKPGGLLFVSVPFDNIRHSLRAILLDAHRRQPETGARRFYQWRLTRAELADALARGGFAVEDVKIIGKRQGLQRLLQHNLRLSPTGLPAKGLAVLLAPIVPAVLVGHMILAIARKPGTGTGTPRPA
jgi:ubiquinone/menaquinone biosynthesis C-methylase UbiE